MNINELELLADLEEMDSELDYRLSQEIVDQQSLQALSAQLDRDGFLTVSSY